MAACQPPIPKTPLDVAALVKKVKEEAALKEPPLKKRRNNRGKQLGLYPMGCRELQNIWWDTPMPPTAAELSRYVSRDSKDPQGHGVAL